MSNASELWGIEKTHEHAEKAIKENKTTKGVRGDPLFDCTDPVRFVFPLLHVLLGLGNRLLSGFMVFVDTAIERHDKKTLEERAKMLEAKMAFVEANEAHGEGAELAALQQDRKMHLECLSPAHEERMAVEERSELQPVKDECSRQTNASETQKRELAVRKKASKAFTDAKKDLKKLEKAMQMHGKPMRLQIEALLRKCGVERPLCHGGDLTGGRIRKLMEVAKALFADIEVLLLATAHCDLDFDNDDPNVLGSVEDEISLWRKRIPKALIAVDSLFLMLRTPNCELDLERDQQEIKKAAEALSFCW